MNRGKVKVHKSIMMFEHNMSKSVWTILSLILIMTVIISPTKVSSSGLSVVNFFIADRNGLQSASAYVNQEIMVKTQFKNDGADEMRFTHIILISDADGSTVKIAWAESKIPTGQTITNSFSWIPEETGTYTVQAFAWESLSTAVPLIKSPIPITVNVVEGSKTNLPDIQKEGASIKIVDIRGYTEYGYPIGLAILKNDGNVPLHFVKVQFDFMDRNNHVVSSDSTYTLLDVIMPAQIAPVKVIASPSYEASSITHIEVKILDYANADTKPYALQASNVSFRLDTYTDKRTVSGRVTNSGSLDATFTKVSVIAMNDKGEIEDIGWAYVTPDSIRPNDYGTFEVTGLSSLDSDKYTIIAESREYSSNVYTIGG